MASELLGRCVCPECNFQSAHVKIKTDKEGANPYRHCPECGAQYFPRNQMQASHLRAKLRAEKNDTPQPAPAAAPPKSDAVLPEPVKPKTKRVFGVEVPV
jgi:hypothetical protein